MINAPAAGSVPTASLILGKAKRHGAIRRTRGERVFAVVNIVVLCLAVAITLFPFLNIIAQSLPLQPGDEILTTDHEYSALEKTWAYVARKTGARIVEVEVPLPLVSAEAFEHAILAAITPRTRVIFLSHITSPTALLFPIEGVIREARARGIVRAGMPRST